MQMKTSQAGIAAIMQREAVKLQAYKDSKGVPTIGVGHTAGVHMGERITRAQAMELLKDDLAVAESIVNKSAKRKLTQNQFDALVSIAFNIGNGGNRFTNSTFMRKFNAGDIKGAAAAFAMWNKSGGRVIQGLVNRRESERKQFLS